MTFLHTVSSKSSEPSSYADFPAIAYTWSFEPKTDWSANYASASEIRQYFTHFCMKNGLEEYIELEHQVVGAEWSEDEGQWHVNVKDLKTGRQLETTAHVLISATGILNKWKWPSIPGLHSFKGKLLHSAAWDETTDLSGKRVGLIGNGYDSCMAIKRTGVELSTSTDLPASRYYQRSNPGSKSFSTSSVSQPISHHPSARSSGGTLTRTSHHSSRIQNITSTCGERPRRQ